MFPWLKLDFGSFQMLAKKVDTLTKAMEVEAKKMRREVAAMEKEVASMREDKEHENRAKRFGNSKGPVSSSQALPARYGIFSFLTRADTGGNSTFGFQLIMSCVGL